MKTRRWIIGGLAAVLLALAGVAVAQLPNTLNISSAASGSAPAIRASGIDANISINLVPKGSGTVQVSGTPIAVGGGTITSLTINPGPFAVTGTTNLTGPLSIQTGTATGLKRVPARIFHNATSAPTVGTTLETLYTATVAANTLATNGESLKIRTTAVSAANGNNKTFLVTFGATTIFSTGAQAFNNDGFVLDCDVFRLTATTQKSVCSILTVESAAATVTNGAGANMGFTVTTPAETLSGAVAILVQGTTPSAAADLTALFATVDWYPVGQ